MGSGKRNYKAMRFQYRKKIKKEEVKTEETKKSSIDPEEYFNNLLKKDGNNTQDN